MGSDPGFFAPRDDERSGPPPRPRWPFAAGAAALLAVVAGLLALSASQDGREAEERERSARRVAELRAEITARQAPRTGSAPSLRPRAGASAAERRAAREALVRTVEAAILRDARRRAASGELDRRATAAECGPILRSRDAVPDHELLDRPLGRYDCVAVTRDIRTTKRSVGRLGYAFVAALDFRRFTYTWCRNTPAQGERGQALVFVRLDRRCLAARGRALGTGYVDDRAR